MDQAQAMPPSAQSTVTLDLWREQAATLAGRLDAREITPTQLIEMYLERCDRLEPSRPLSVARTK